MSTTLLDTAGADAQVLDVRGRRLVDTHAQITSILRNRLGPRHAALLATPVAGPGDGLTWTTEAAGAAVPAVQLGPDERARLQQRADALRADISALAARMRSEGGSGHLVSYMLERALMQPPGDWLYAVGGEPVLVMWGHAAPGTVLPPVEGQPPPAPPPLPVPPPPLPLPAAPTAPEAGLPPAAAVAPAAAGRRSTWAWVLGALLLAVLLLFGLKHCADLAGAEAEDIAARLRAAEERNRQLEDEIRRKQAATLQCVADPPPASAPEPPASASEPPASARTRLTRCASASRAPRSAGT